MRTVGVVVLLTRCANRPSQSALCRVVVWIQERNQDTALGISLAHLNISKLGEIVESLAVSTMYLILAVNG